MPRYRPSYNAVHVA